MPTRTVEVTGTGTKGDGVARAPARSGFGGLAGSGKAAGGRGLVR